MNIEQITNLINEGLIAKGNQLGAGVIILADEPMVAKILKKEKSKDVK